MRIGTLMKQIDPEPVGLHELTNDELHKLQEVLTNMMQDVAEVCEKNNISWSLSGGSLLGCVRHKGFIPWDDDMDIVMTRRNYEKFREIFSEYLSEKYYLKEPGQKGYVMHYPQITKKETTAKIIQSVEETKDGIFIDIVILENTYDNKLRRTLFGIQCTMLLFIDSIMRMDRCKENLLKYCVQNKELYRKIKNRIRLAWLFKFRSLEQWLCISDKIFSKVANDKSKYVVAIAGSKHYFGEIFSREKMCTLKKSEFSGRKFYIESDPDYYLKKRYGTDYMTLPPDGMKEKHIYVEFDFES